MTKLIGTLAGSLLVVAVATNTASAQTYLTLNAPDSEVVDTFIRGGAYENTSFDNEGLVTKSNANASYTRRALLKFDTETRVPAGTPIQSAILTLTLKTSEADTRTLTAYRVTNSFDEGVATWRRRKVGYGWASSGGDLGEQFAQATVAATPGAQVTFDVTSLVQAAINGSFGSRYTRIALVDRGASSSASYKEFYSSEAADPAQRPKLEIVYGGVPPPPPPAPAPTSTLKVLHWNTHYGIGYYDGVYNIDRIATWIASARPDVVSLNEVERYVSGHGNEDQPARYAALLAAKTGQPWYYHFAQRYGNWTAKGGGNLVLSRFPIDATGQLELVCDRSAALATMAVNGRTVNVVSTHLDNDSSSCRAQELQQLLPWLRGFAEQRVLVGDFNASINIPYVYDEYNDGWLVAKALGAAIDIPGNTRSGATHSYRIDYIFHSKGASSLVVKAAQVFDARDANGVKMSDHKPLLVTYDVK